MGVAGYRGRIVCLLFVVVVVVGVVGGGGGGVGFRIDWGGGEEFVRLCSRRCL